MSPVESHRSCNGAFAAVTFFIIVSITCWECIIRVLLSDRPDVVIGTPSKVLALLQAKVYITVAFGIVIQLDPFPRPCRCPTLNRSSSMRQT